MHTLDIPSARARIFHNGDWLGDVEVLLGVNPIGHPDQDAPPTARLRIPAAVFAAVAVKMLEEALQDVRSPSRAVVDESFLASTCDACEEPLGEDAREGAIRHVCGSDGPCTYHRTGGVPEYKCSGVAK